VPLVLLFRVLDRNVLPFGCWFVCVGESLSDELSTDRASVNYFFVCHNDLSLG